MRPTIMQMTAEGGHKSNAKTCFDIQNICIMKETYAIY